MKIAICVSGSLRKFKTCLPYFNKYITDDLKNKGHKVDVFLHVWKFKQNPKDLKHNFKWYEDIEIFDDKEIISLYNPKKYVIEEFTDKRMEEIVIEQKGEFVLDKTKTLISLDPNSKQGVNERRLINMYGMYYKIYACNELKKEIEKEEGKYDIVMRTRPDLIYQHPFSYYSETLFEDIVKDKLLVYMNCRSGICDHFCLGSSDITDQYCSIFLGLTNIFKNHKNITSEMVMIKLTNGINKREFNKIIGKNIYKIHHIIERLFQKDLKYSGLPRIK